MKKERTNAESAELVRLFHLAGRMMARYHHRGDQGRHAQHHLLAIIMEKGPISQKELMELLDVRSSSLSELLRKLEHKGLIVRERDERDRRSFVVSATESSGSVMSGKTSGNEGPESVFACLDETERVQLHGILSKIVGALAEEPQGRMRECVRSGLGRGQGGPGRGRGAGRGSGRSRGGRK